MRPRRLLSHRRREAYAGLLFVLPMALLFIIFRFGPSLAGLLLGFFDYYPGDTPEFVGVENFKRLAEDPNFWTALKVTLIFGFLSVPTGLAISTVMALLVRRGSRTVNFFRSVYFLPVITSLVVAAAVFGWFFSTGGPVSSVQSALGLGDASWLRSETLVILALVVVNVWTRYGYGMLILLARLQDQPRELEDAMRTDGASSMQRFRHLTLPHLRPALFFLAVIETTASFQIFDLVYLMTGGGPARASHTLVLDLYERGFRNLEFGMASAIGGVLFVLTLVVAGIQHFMLGRDRT
ncbi:sugar ABC transporter permease [Knoellia sinensis KCTC 19936]|uniref:Sugar ABC transporter permease n=1 Tax=Knoellia sinensis KCTC 19936 TaxID=1385520 RepID=A0A0A0J098_9MICO|nr:sugar ABC transporter permease [Knoellia sinensis KCTC 19936]